MERRIDQLDNNNSLNPKTLFQDQNSTQPINNKIIIISLH